MIKFLKDWTLPVAMCIGMVGYPFFIRLQFLTPYLIFIMLLLTFCKISPRDLKIEPLHYWLLALQILGAMAFYWALAPFDPLVAQGALVCIIAPSATAAAVITQKLGGDAASLTTFTLLSNLGTALAVPLLFPWIEPHEGLTFWASFTIIIVKVFPLLICPFLLAWFLRVWMPSWHRKLTKLHDAAFYLWSVALIIAIAITLSSLIEVFSDTRTKILLGLVALIACCLQFYFGKRIGSVYQNRISGGQALGQKNTILAIWIAHTYLNPVSAIAPGAYVLWQNTINSWQLWKKRKRDARTAF